MSHKEPWTSDELRTLAAYILNNDASRSDASEGLFSAANEIERLIGEVHERDEIVKGTTAEYVKIVEGLTAKLESAENRWKLAMNRLHERFGDGLAVHKAGDATPCDHVVGHSWEGEDAGEVFWTARDLTEHHYTYPGGVDKRFKFCPECGADLADVWKAILAEFE